MGTSSMSVLPGAFTKRADITESSSVVTRRFAPSFGRIANTCATSPGRYDFLSGTNLIDPLTPNCFRESGQLSLAFVIQRKPPTDAKVLPPSWTTVLIERLPGVVTR